MTSTDTSMVHASANAKPTRGPLTPVTPKTPDSPTSGDLSGANTLLNYRIAADFTSIPLSIIFNSSTAPDTSKAVALLMNSSSINR